MSKKRKYSEQFSADMYDDTSTGNKDRNSTSTSGGGNIDPLYGQRSALPCVDGGDDGNEDSSAALKYLQDVRDEAFALPSLATASSPSLTQQPSAEDEEDNADDTYAPYPDAYYFDGAYTALPSASSFQPNPRTSAQADDEDLDPQDAYYAALLLRFSKLQVSLRNASASLGQDDQGDIRAAVLRSKKRSQWRGKILRTTPSMRTLAALDQENILFGLGQLSEVLTLGNLKKRKDGANLGAWGWGLLGRCRPMGEMGSEDVGTLRILGKQAGWCLRRWAVRGGTWGGEEQGDEEDEDEGEDVVSIRDAEESTLKSNETGIGAVVEAQEPLLNEADSDILSDSGHEAAQQHVVKTGEASADRMADAMANEGMYQARDEMEGSGTDNKKIDIDGLTTNGIINEGEEHIQNPANVGLILEPTKADGIAAADDVEEGEIDDAEEDNSGDPEIIKAAQERLLASLQTSGQEQMDDQEQTPQSHIMATLDMILTVVGEVYGQRDLLDGRLLWDEL